jgi:Contractile injection system tube protein/LysM domain
MPEQPEVKKAEMRELKPDGTDTSYRVTVQFNPESLKVSFANQVVPPSNPGAQDQRANSTQFVGKGTTKLSVQLWFDISSVLPEGKQNVTDVRDLTKEVIYFITPKPSDEDPTKNVPPGLRFLWGSFQFDGIVDSLEESLEFFSQDGRPLRASVSLSMSQQKIEVLRNPEFQPGAPGAPGGTRPPGTRPLSQAASGDSVQGMASSRGRAGNWQEIAAANNIENPRLLQPGQLIDLNATVSTRVRGGR